MRETGFIQQNKDKWKKLESVLEQEQKDPKELNELFVQVTDDLSYSRTFYPNRSVRVYLNGLAQKIFYSIYKNRRNRKARLINFWKEELPLIVYNSRVAFRLSFGVFVIALLIGVISSIYDADFPKAILGEEYVSMTIANVDSGDPMAVYKSDGMFGMALGITINNIWVAFRTFILGVFFMVGSIFILVYNGIMVGAFQYMFYDFGLLQESALTIWMHGALEISSIVIAGAAGITMGRGLVFPGTLPRTKAFQLSARRGLKIMIGITPIFILAGFIEGFITRLTDVPDIIRFIFILICFAFIIGYFVILPILVGRSGKKIDMGVTELQPDHVEDVDLGKIKSTGALFADLFIFLRLNLGAILGTSAIGTLLFCIGVLLLGSGAPSNFFATNSFISSALDPIALYYSNDDIFLLPLLNAGIYTFLTYQTISLFQKKLVPTVWKKIQAKKGSQGVRILILFFISCAVALLFYIGNALAVLAALFLTPLIFFWYFHSALPGFNPIDDFRSTLKFSSDYYSKGISLFLIITLLLILFLFVTETSLINLLVEAFTMNITVDLVLKEEITIMAYTAIQIFILNLFFCLACVIGGLLYYSALEKRTANHLRQQISKIGLKQTIRGLEKEQTSYAK